MQRDVRQGELGAGEGTCEGTRGTCKSFPVCTGFVTRSSRAYMPRTNLRGARRFSVYQMIRQFSQRGEAAQMGRAPVCHTITPTQVEVLQLGL
jgi:hypothetical protein